MNYLQPEIDVHNVYEFSSHFFTHTKRTLRPIAQSTSGGLWYLFCKQHEVQMQKFIVHAEVNWVLGHIYNISI